jgi:membrane protein required for colicin V production
MQIGSVHLAMIDLAAIAVLLIFLVRGIMKGFVSQLMLLITVVGGLLVARWLAPQIQPAVKRWLGPKVSEGSQLDIYISYFMIFLAFLVVVGLISRSLHKTLTRLSLESFNRSMGALTGVLLGACFIVAIVVGVSHMGWSEADQALKGTYTARFSYHAVATLAPIFPEDVKERISAYLKPLEQDLEEDAAKAKELEHTTTSSHKK